MTIKCTLLFNGQSSNPRGRDLTYGFSETWFSNQSELTVVAALHAISEKRALLLAKDTKIVGYRIGDVTGRSQVVTQTWNAPSGNDAGNVPVDSALCIMRAASGSPVKRFWVHDLPDDWVTGGALEPARRNAVLEYLRAVEANQFLIRFVIQTAANAPVLSVDAAGNVVTTANIALVVNNYVSFLRARDNNNKAIRGKFVVETVTDGTHFKLANWTGQIVGNRGRVRLVAYDYIAARVQNRNVDSWLIKCGARKVGRPFFQLRGRAPNRR